MGKWILVHLEIDVNTEEKIPTNEVCVESWEKLVEQNKFDHAERFFSMRDEDDDRNINSIVESLKKQLKILFRNSKVKNELINTFSITIKKD